MSGDAAFGAMTCGVVQCIRSRLDEIATLKRTWGATGSRSCRCRACATPHRTTAAPDPSRRSTRTTGSDCASGPLDAPRRRSDDAVVVMPGGDGRSRLRPGRGDRATKLRRPGRGPTRARLAGEPGHRRPLLTDRCRRPAANVCPAPVRVCGSPARDGCGPRPPRPSSAATSGRPAAPRRTLALPDTMSSIWPGSTSMKMPSASAVSSPWW